MGEYIGGGVSGTRVKYQMLERFLRGVAAHGPPARAAHRAGQRMALERLGIVANEESGEVPAQTSNVLNVYRLKG